MPPDAPQWFTDAIDAPSTVSEIEVQGARVSYRSWGDHNNPGVLLVRALRPAEPENGEEALAGFLIARFLQGLLVATVLFRIAWLGRAAVAPAGLLCLLAIGLSPLLVQQSFGVTSDTVVNAFALALAGWLALPDRLTRADHAAVAALGVVAMLTKPVLAPVLPAALLLRRGPDAASLRNRRGLTPAELAPAAEPG